VVVLDSLIGAKNYCATPGRRVFSIGHIPVPDRRLARLRFAAYLSPPGKVLTSESSGLHFYRSFFAINGFLSQTILWSTQQSELALVA
jgi:hypothetical protein